MEQPTPRRPGPIGGDMANIVVGLARRMRLTSLTERYDDSTWLLGWFAMINSVIVLGAPPWCRWA